MARQKLTGKVVQETKPETGKLTDTMIWDTAEEGFFLRVRPSGRKTFGVQMQVNGRQVRLNLGTASPATLDETRKLAAAKSGTKDWSLHDIRRTYRSMLSDLGFDEDLSERMIAHSRDNLLERYDRSTRWPERVAAAEAVERHILKIVAGQDGGNVVQLQPRASA